MKPRLREFKKLNRIQEDRALTQKKMGKTGQPTEFIWHVHPRATAKDLFLEIRQRHATAGEQRTTGQGSGASKDPGL